jgi:hypothetical protein
LENKIVLLSRETYITQKHVTTLVVGYRLPNERAEVQKLIEDISHAFEITIGVLDFATLVELVARVKCENRSFVKSDFITLGGLIGVETVTAK